MADLCPLAKFRDVSKKNQRKIKQAKLRICHASWRESELFFFFERLKYEQKYIKL